MLLIGGLLTLGFIGVLLLAVYAKTMTDDNKRLRAIMNAAGQLADCIFNPADVAQYQQDPTLQANDRTELLAALADPDGKAASDLLS